MDLIHVFVMKKDDFGEEVLHRRSTDTDFSESVDAFILNLFDKDFEAVKTAIKQGRIHVVYGGHLQEIKIKETEKVIVKSLEYERASDFK